MLLVKDRHDGRWYVHDPLRRETRNRTQRHLVVASRKTVAHGNNYVIGLTEGTEDGADPVVVDLT